MVAGAELADDKEVGVFEDDALAGDAALEAPAELVGQHLVIPVLSLIVKQGLCLKINRCKKVILRYIEEKVFNDFF